MRVVRIWTVAVVVALGLAACGGSDTPVAEPSPTGEEVAVERAVVPNVVGKTMDEAVAALKSAGLVPSPAGTGAQVATQTPAAGISVDLGTEVLVDLADPEPGTSGNPFPAGTTLNSTVAGANEVTLLIDKATWNADDVVMAENGYHAPAPEGSSYVLVPVTVMNVSSAEAVTPSRAFDISYVAPDGRPFHKALFALSNDLTSIGDLNVGDIGSGTLAFVLPNDAQGGKWQVRAGWQTLPVYVVAD